MAQILYRALDVLATGERSTGAALYELPNVVITPHIAGSMDGECRRMGRAMVDELRRYLAGERLRWQITRERVVHMA